MSSKSDKYWGMLAVFAILAANTAMTFAESEMETISFTAGGEETEVEEEISESELEDFEETGEVMDKEPEEKVDRGLTLAEKQDQFLARLKGELNLSKAEYKQLLTTVSDTNLKLEELAHDHETLSSQIAHLDHSINKTTKKLVDVIKQIIEKENEILLLYEQIDTKEIEIEYQKELIRDYVRIMYQEENNYFSLGEDGEIEAFKLLLADDTVGNNLKKIEYFDLLNEAGQQMIEGLTDMSEELLIHQRDLDKSKKKLVELQEELEEEKAFLEEQKLSKENLLALTQGQEEIYSQLLEQAVEEQEDLLNDVKNLTNAVEFIEKKIEDEGLDFNPDEYLSLLDYRTQVLFDFRYRNSNLNPDGFAWPIEPDRGLTAYFHDPDYMGSFGIQHNAIDIPVYQGSPVRATAEGVVYTTKENGYGYSYIILAHAGGFMSVYGHMSAILVEEGDLINQGTIIGLSGGMPGTIGAGYMTTGPHLHFEMLSSGLYIDPLDYLPLKSLSEDHVLELPEKYYDDWEESVFGDEFEAIERF